MSVITQKVSKQLWYSFQIKKLRIGRDNRGNSPDWLLEKVTLDDFQRNERYVFNCNSWLLGKDPELEFEPGENCF